MLIADGILNNRINQDKEKSNKSNIHNKSNKNNRQNEIQIKKRHEISCPKYIELRIKRPIGCKPVWSIRSPVVSGTYSLLFDSS